MNQELVSLTEMERRDSLRQYIETSVSIEISSSAVLTRNLPYLLLDFNGDRIIRCDRLSFRIDNVAGYPDTFHDQLLP